MNAARRKKTKPRIATLLRVLRQNDAREARRLLAEGVDPNGSVSSSYGGPYTALMTAAGALSPECVKVLLDAGAEVDTTTADGEGARGGETALHMAINGRVQDKVDPSEEETYERRIAVIDLLLRAGADTEIAFGGDETPLYSAASGGDIEIVQMLLKAGARVNPTAAGVMPPLYGAAFNGHEDLVCLFLNAGASVNADTEGLTPLMGAAYAGHKAVVKLLLDAGADVNRHAENGRTALISAAWFDKYAFFDDEHELALDIAKNLVAAGADPSLRDSDGNTAYDIALQSEVPALAGFLKPLTKPRPKSKK